MYIIYVIIRCNLNPKLGPPIPADQMTPFTLAKVGRLLKSMLPPVLLIAAVMGTIFAGIAPPTEAAAVGCAAAILLAIIYRKFSWSMLKLAAMETLKVSAFVVLIAAMSYAFVGIFMNAGAGDVVAEMILSVPGGKWASFAVVMLIVFVLGMFIEWIGIVFIVVPIFSIIFAKLGFDPLWAGMMVVVNLQMAFMTPPMAMSIFVLKGTAPKEYGLTMGDIIRGVLPFVGIVAIVLVLMVLFPQIITWLPGKMFVNLR
jgi:tripartite ATP-independent transporter DctM subunit